MTRLEPIIYDFFRNMNCPKWSKNGSGQALKMSKNPKWPIFTSKWPLLGKNSRQKSVNQLFVATTGAKKATASVHWTIHTSQKWMRSSTMLQRSFSETSYDLNLANISLCARETTTSRTVLRKLTLLLCEHNFFSKIKHVNPCGENDQLIVHFNFAKNGCAKRSKKREAKLRVKK